MGIVIELGYLGLLVEKKGSMAMGMHLTFNQDGLNRG
jgi:hypothetical protein